MTEAETPVPGGDTPETQRLVLVTGPSGAGRSTAIKALEDIGFEAIDNLPITLLPRLLDGPPLARPLALGLDPRNRDFSPSAFLEFADGLEAHPGISATVLYLDCRADVLLRRYSETRRRHPLAPDEAPEIGIAREMDMLGPVRNRADLLIDTSDLTPHDLRDELVRWFDSARGDRMSVSVQSFSYKRGLPAGVDMVLDVRFLRNPHWDVRLRPLDGRSDDVVAYVEADPRLGPFLERTMELLDLLLPAYRGEGKSHFALAFGCTGGQHRSVALAEKTGKALAGKGWQVSIRHRELERQADRPLPSPKSG